MAITTVKTTFRVTEAASGGLIKRLVDGGLERGADKIARSYALRVQAKAIETAPDAQRKREEYLSNNPHEVSLNQTIVVAKSTLEPASYSIRVKAPWYVFLYTGARPHTIKASGKAGGRGLQPRKRMLGYAKQAGRLTQQLQRLEERNNYAFATFVDKHGVDRQRKLSYSQRLTAQYRALKIQGIRLKISGLLSEASAIRGGHRNTHMLSFPYGYDEVGRVRTIFQPEVDHPGMKANPFMQRAVAYYRLPFYQALRRLLETGVA